MSVLLVAPSFGDEERRSHLYAGDIVMYPRVEAFAALCDLAWELIQEAFDGLDPATAQYEIPVERYVDIIAPLKPRFTHHPRSKELLRDTLDELGCDVHLTHFDVPKLRIVTSDGYLTAGVGYAYKAHRDTWYACPPSQINWWGPITPIEARCGLAFHPEYFAEPIPNNSQDFDAYAWNASGRKDAAKYITSDSRPHPHVPEEIALQRQIYVGEPGSLILFSAQQLHATVPNDSGRTRFSIDFRTVHHDDIVARRGADVFDSSATGTTLRDFLAADDHHRFSDDIIAMYDDGERHDGVLIFEPDAPT